MALKSALYCSGENDLKYFYQMKIASNVVNLAIVGCGLYSALNPDTMLTFKSTKQQSNIEKILLFNADLDIRYIMTGFYLIEKANNSLLLQGGFLVLFDLMFYFIKRGNHELTKNYWSMSM